MLEALKVKGERIGLRVEVGVEEEVERGEDQKDAKDQCEVKIKDQNV